jgi:hypothetical protein
MFLISIKKTMPWDMDLRIYRKSKNQPIDFIHCDFHLRKGEEEKQEEDLQEIREALQSLQLEREKLSSIQNPHR